MDVRIVSGRYEKALKLTLWGLVLTFVLVHGVARALLKLQSARMECLLWQPGTHSLGTGSCGVRKPNDTSAVGLGSFSDVSDTGELGL